MFSFKDARTEDQYDSLHQELKDILEEFGHWSASAKIPMPVVTCLGRSDGDNAELYSGKARFSWHIPGKDGIIRAMDLRVLHYTPEQKARVFQWFLERCPDPKKFELILKIHGTGPHIHLGLRR